MQRTPILDAHLLGGFRLTWNHQPVTGFAQARLQHLLAYLLLHHQTTLSRRQVAFLFWPETNDEQALSNLRTLLHRLRTALPESERFLTFDRHCITWRNDPTLHLDVAEFEAALASAAQAAGSDMAIPALQAAVDSYPGDLLPDCYDEWIIPHRERLHQAFEQALVCLIDLQEIQHQYQGAVGNTRRLLAIDPLHEGAHRTLIRVHLAAGDHVSALRAYHRCAAILRQELGIDPAPATQALYLRLLHAGDEFVPLSVPPPADARTPARTPSLTGRRAEWANLLAAWQGATSGTARMVLISGEAGMGTTRLAEELAAWVVHAGGDVASARCHPDGAGLPYASITDWLRSAAVRPRLAGLTTRHLIEIARVAPELVDEHLDPTARGTPGVEWQRHRFFDALAAPLVAPGRPLLLLIDDLHHCDRETLEWLPYLLDKTHGTPLLLLGTAHAESLLDGHPLLTLRLALQRRDRWQEVRLGPLSLDESCELATSLAGRTLSACEVRHLYHDSEGNPLFLVETVRGGLIDEVEPQADADPSPHGPLCPLCPRRRHSPPRVQAVIEQRLAQVSPAGRSLAQTAAVIGRQFDLRLLQQVTDLDQATLVQAIDELWQRGIVREEGIESYDFSHDKLRAGAYASMSRAQRQMQHRCVAEALRANAADQAGMAARLAHHYDAAGDQATAASFWLHAGDDARAVGALDQADANYRRAAVLLQARGELAAAGQVMLKLGLAHHAAFDFAAAHAAYDEGFALLARQATRPATASGPQAHLTTLRLARLVPQTLDPAADGGEDAWLIDQLCAGLVQEGPDMAILPDVARDWQITGDGRIYTFHLRHDAFWSDGVPVTAGDFEHGWRRVLDPARAAPFAGLLDDLVGVEVLDPCTLRVTLAAPSNHFLYVLTHRVAFPVPRHVVARWGPAWCEPAHLVGNGPFRLADWTAGHSLRLVRSADYHGRYAGNVGEVQVTLLLDWADQVALYDAGQLDVMPLDHFDHRAAVRLHRHHAGELHAVPDLRVNYIAFDTRRAPFADVRVRRAFGMAVDRHHLATALMFGYEFAASAGFVPAHAGLSSQVPGDGLPYAPARAQELLAEAGFAGGRGLPVIELWGGQGSGSWAAAGEYLAQQWQQVLGARVERRTVAADELVRLMSPGGPHAFCIGWRADYPDPDNFLRMAPIGRQTGWCHAQYDELVARARGMGNAAARLDLYRQAEAILAGDVPVLPLTYARWYALIKPCVTSFPMSAMRRWFLKDVVVDPA